MRDWRSEYAGHRERERIVEWEFVHKCTKFGCTRHSRNTFRSALVGTNSLTALQNSCCRESITFPIREFFRSDVECIDHEVASTAWEKTRRCRRCGVRGVFFLRRLRKRQADDFRFGKFFRRLCLCGNRCGRGSRRLLEWRGLGRRCSDG